MSIKTRYPLVLRADLIPDSGLIPDELDLGTFCVAVGEYPDGYDFGNLIVNQALWIKKKEQEPIAVDDNAVFQKPEKVVEGSFEPGLFYWENLEGVKIAEFNLPVVKVIYSAIKGSAVVVVPPQIDTVADPRSTFWLLPSPDKETWKRVDYFSYNAFKLDNICLMDGPTPSESLEEQIEKEKAVSLEDIKRKLERKFGQ